MQNPSSALDEIQSYLVDLPLFYSLKVKLINVTNNGL